MEIKIYKKKFLQKKILQKIILQKIILQKIILQKIFIHKMNNYKNRILNYKENYNSIIPLKVYQTWYTKNLPENMKKTIEFNKKQNPMFEFFVFDNNECREFIIKHFNYDVIDAFDILKPGAYKADLWRYCILYVNGGIYIDIKFKCVNNFKLISLTEKEHFTTDAVIKEYPNEDNKGVYNGFMISLPKNQKLLKAINQIVINVKNHYYGNSTLDTTGPIMFGKFFSYEEKKNALVRRYVDKQGNGVSIRNILILDEYPEYRMEQNKSSIHYHHYWNNRDIFNENKLSNNDILFVTAFKDINRINFKTHKRSVDDYIKYFLNFANNIKYNLVVFLEEDIKKKITNKYNFNKNIIFENFSNVNTFYNNFLNKEKEIMNSQTFRSKLSHNRIDSCPEVYSPEYTLINHSKINFVKYAKDKYNSYQFYSWIDFGYVRNVDDVPKIFNHNLEKKIIYQTMLQIPEKKIYENELINLDDMKYIAGSSFIIYKDLIDIFETKYKEKIIEWQNNYICDDDQSLVLQLFYENKNLFKLIIDSNWFQLFKHM
jgi:mannosyltransferase OCH1-like enzyme